MAAGCATLQAIVARFHFERLPGSNALLEHVNAAEPVVALAACHADAGAMLAQIVGLLLPEQHAAEIAGLSFAFKVDVCIACGFLAVESREAFQAFDAMAAANDVSDAAVQGLFLALSTAQHDFVGDVKQLLAAGRHVEVLREMLAGLLFEVKAAWLGRARELLKKEIARHLTQEILEGRDFRTAEEKGLEFGQVVVRRMEAVFKTIVREND